MLTCRPQSIFVVGQHNFGSFIRGDSINSYHPTEERVWVKKLYNASSEVAETTIYISDTFVRVVNSSGTYDFAYIKHEGQLVAQVAVGGNTEFIHGDNKGSSTVVTDSLGNAIENTSYEPFGGIVSGGAKTLFDYEGKEFDSVVGDYDFHARRYNPRWGQFITPDTLIQNVYDPQSLNRFAFERNNPYNRFDPDGHNQLYLGAFVLGFAVGTVYYGATHIGEGRGGFGNFAAYMAKGIGSGTIAGLATLASTALVTSGGRIAAASFGANAGQFGISVGEYVGHQLLKGDDINLDDAVIAGISSRINPFGLQGGTFVSSSNILAKNSLKIYGNIIGSSFAQFGLTWLKNVFSNTLKDTFGYLSQDGKFYPTNNPNWKPNDDTTDSSDKDSSGGGPDYSQCRAYGDAKCGS